MLERRVLNRTLLRRQHLLQRVTMPAIDMVEHLLGLQAQDTLPPYVGLWSRIEGFDPAELSRLVERREAVRVVLMRGTLHLVSVPDAVLLRPLVQPTLDKITRNSTVSREAAAVPSEELAVAGREALAGGALPFKELGERLSGRFPDFPATALANRLREMTPLVQLPPRGLWKQSGAVVYERLESWVSRELETEPDLSDVVRRYLRAFGPATAADLTTWSGMTGTRAVLEAMGDELIRHSDESGRTLFDLAGLLLADPDEPAPVRLLGKYDNFWLSHADRTRTAEKEKRTRWMGRNGGTGNTVFVDGMLEGLWRQVDGQVEVEPFRRLTRQERSELDGEVTALEEFLAR